MDVGNFGAAGFWFFLAAVVVGGMWFDARKRESQQETLRRIVESGKNIDQDMINKFLAAGGSNSRPDQDLKVGGIITMAVAPGLTILGWFISKTDGSEEVFSILLGVSLLVGIIGAGIFLAGKMSERWYNESQR